MVLKVITLRRPEIGLISFFVARHQSISTGWQASANFGNESFASF
jgi:hypothetical protein